MFGHLYARLAPNGDVPAAEARVDVVGFSAVERNKPDARMDIERTRLQLSWSGQERRLRINPVEVFAHNSRFALTGQAHPVDDAADAWAFSITGTEQAVPGADPTTHALRFDRIEASGKLERTARRLIFDKASVQGRSLSVAGYGTFDFSGQRPMGDFAIAGSRSPVAAVLRVWPGLIASGTRNWVRKNVPAAMVEDMSIAMRGPIGGKMLQREIALDARFSDATVSYLDDVPPAVGVHGHVSIVNERMETVINGGRVELGAVEPLSIAGTRFSTLDHRLNPFLGNLEAKIEGSVAAVGTLMSVPRLAKMAPGVAPLMRGNGTVSILLTLAGEYGKDADMSKLVPRIDASLTGWSMENAIGSRDIDNGNFTLKVEPETANLRGEVRLSGAPLAVEAILNRTPDNKFADTVVRFSLDPSKMKDFDSEALRIAGPVSAELVQDAPGVLTNSRMRADLTGAAVEGPVGLAKAGGQPGQVSFTIQPHGDNWRLDEFVAQGSGIDIRGTVDLAKSGGLAGASVHAFPRERRRRRETRCGENRKRLQDRDAGRFVQCAAGAEGHHIGPAGKARPRHRCRSEARHRYRPERRGAKRSRSQNQPTQQCNKELLSLRGSSAVAPSRGGRSATSRVGFTVCARRTRAPRCALSIFIAACAAAS